MLRTSQEHRARDEAIELRDLINDMPTDPDGILHLGTDGVLRSLSAKKEVIGFVQLSPSELASYAEDQLHPSSETRRDPKLLARYIQDTWGEVDGRDVTLLDDLLNPRGFAITPWHPSGEIDSRSPCNDCGKICARDNETEEVVTGTSQDFDRSHTSRQRNRSLGGLVPRVCLSAGFFCYSNKECAGGRNCKCVFAKCTDTGTCKTKFI